MNNFFSNSQSKCEFSDSRLDSSRNLNSLSPLHASPSVRNPVLSALSEGDLRLINGPIPEYWRSELSSIGLSKNSFLPAANRTFGTNASTRNLNQTNQEHTVYATIQGQSKVMHRSTTNQMNSDRTVDNLKQDTGPNTFVPQGRLFIRNWQDLFIIDRKLNLWLRRNPERRGE
ncbi:hypothetical protein BGZ46_007793 [Entomortierella lignicola]|nr:hypothetical protein BGZ46_007793 [Entomortierella lignicola]